MKKESVTVFLNNNGNKFSLNFLAAFFLVLIVFLYLVLKSNLLQSFDFLRKIVEPYVGFFEGFLAVLIIFISTYFFVGFTKKVIRGYLTNLGRSKKNIKLFLVVYGYFIWIFVIIITFSIVLKQGASLITSIGLIGFGLTLALQKPILNFAGWITIIFGKAYHIGDVILINNAIGRVYDIRVMYTYLGELNPEGDPSGRAIFVPNEFVFTNTIINYSKGTPFVWDTINFHVTYKSNWKKAAKIIEQTVQKYYDKNIKKDAEKTFKDSFSDYKKVVMRINAHEKGISIKVRYMVDFEKANDIKKEITEILLSKLHSKDIVLGKTESV